MLRIEAAGAELQMGSEAGKGYPSEQPRHLVRFARSFEIGRFEVTFDEYDLYAAATRRAKPNDEGWGRGARAVINVSWQDAKDYAAWLSAKTGKQYRLPTEAEWEHAVRAGTTTRRYWNETPDQNPDPACAHANVFDRGNIDRIEARYGAIRQSPFPCEDPYPFTAPVGAPEFKPNAWGLHDSIGNVWEWAQDCWHEDYESRAPSSSRVSP